MAQKPHMDRGQLPRYPLPMARRPRHELSGVRRQAVLHQDGPGVASLSPLAELPDRPGVRALGVHPTPRAAGRVRERGGEGLHA